jgi:hypothetical protein
MAWIAITETDVLTKLSAPELAALKGAAKDPSQTTILADVITQVVREVRGYVAANAENTLGEGETIPDELLAAALARIRFELAGRLPVAALLTDDRRTANSNAIALLRDVAGGRFRLVTPATPTTETLSAPRPTWAGRPRSFTRDQEDGA